jgi:hypothetical protein
VNGECWMTVLVRRLVAFGPFANQKLPVIHAAAFQTASPLFRTMNQANLRSESRHLSGKSKHNSPPFRAASRTGIEGMKRKF